MSTPNGWGGLNGLAALSGLIRAERRGSPRRRRGPAARVARTSGAEASPEGTARPSRPQPPRPGPGPASRAAGSRLRAWAELLRVPALFTVPGDALAGAAAAGVRPNSRTLLAIGSSLCLYEAGMALNDWADRAEDAVDRPHRPLPSGRIGPAAALVAAGGLTAAGLALASRAGRGPLAVAGALAATVWSYDLVLKRTPAGPVAMAAARGLDLLLGSAASGGDTRKAVPSALTLAAHTLAVTTVSRQETQGGSPLAPLAALATTTALTWSLTRDTGPRDTGPRDTRTRGTRSRDTGPRGTRTRDLQPGLAPEPVVSRPSALRAASSFRPPDSRAAPFGEPARRRITLDIATLSGALTALYAVTSARPLLHAALNPSPPLTQRAVGGGIRAMIPLQAALAARSGAPVTALLTAALAPAARRFGRKVSVT
ncbi:4-hydroxybenzoate polyprenyltransferase [Streptomyces sp. V3I8]|uniref:SCO3242 family prenyltransferase n=1 Tax=Streptomyces sp. V3I8 TaxID=3042279 RepID=UPI0027869556|nr:UbiA family prenyltransferase [Streptomyces sp. V3I8]MDQ1035055.1 4-hydroxybenzoate polyprenyltransferase [Streptomyces sp. V3I8]